MLSASQKQAFAEQGYFVLQGFVPPDLLESLRTLFDSLLVPDDGPNKLVITNDGSRFVTNLDCLCPKGNLAVLELLGHQPLLDLARAICGDDVFLIQEFAVIKHRGDELPVLWHQDMVNLRTGPAFNIGIYLDPVDEGDGALRVVPGSHVSGRDICELAREPFVEVPMRAGDGLVHDMMLAHSSEPMRKGALRRVIYMEFVSAAHVLGEGIYDRALVDRRTRLLFAARRLHAERHPDAPAYVLPHRHPQPDDEARPLSEVLDDIHSLPINARPSSYCVKNAAIFSAFQNAP